MVRKKIVVNTRFEGVHHWPDCPHEDVAFLRDKHRHIFHVRCEKDVAHSNRDVEFIRLKRELDLTFDQMGLDLGSMSCEMIAHALLLKFDLSLCEVLEDGENGGVVSRY